MKKSCLKKVIQIIALVFTSALLTTCLSLSGLSADEADAAYSVDAASAAWRTGTIDPAVEVLAGQYNALVFAEPAAYLPKLVQAMIAAAENDYHYIKIVYDWISRYIAYDTQRDYSSQSDAAYELLKLARTTCGGYVRLFKEMADLAGVECRIINGYSKNYGTARGDLGTHAWNAVQINGTWYLVDVTSGSRLSSRDNKVQETIDAYDDIHLFVSPQAKILVDFPMDEENQFLARPRSLAWFKQLPQTSPAFYYFDLKFSDPVFLKNLVKLREPRAGWTYLQIRDTQYSSSNTVRLVLEAPADISFRPYIKDTEGKILPDTALVYREAGKVLFEFRPPTPGRYSAYINASASLAEARWRQVYQFDLVIQPDARNQETSASASAQLASQARQQERLGPQLTASYSSEESPLVLLLFWYDFKTVDAGNAITRQSFYASVPYPSQKVQDVISISARHRLEQVSRHQTDDNFKLTLIERVPVVSDRPFFFGFGVLGSRKTDLEWTYNGPDFLLDQKLDASFQPYLESNTEYNYHDPLLQTALQKILDGNPEYLETVQRIWHLVYDSIRYKSITRPNSASEVLAAGGGFCGEFTKLTIALLRGAGIPARMVGSLSTEPLFSTSDHVWAEAYIPNIGWTALQTQTEPPDSFTFPVAFKTYFVMKRYSSLDGDTWLHFSSHNGTGEKQLGHFHFALDIPVEDQRLFMELYRSIIDET
ncbi:MAG: hypothetical protein KKI09_06560 [Spirochaetes bacterium]|nr:hypothetical protein [Spirochaetota bacterium]